MGFSNADCVQLPPVSAPGNSCVGQNQNAGNTAGVDPNTGNLTITTSDGQVSFGPSFQGQFNGMNDVNMELPDHAITTAYGPNVNGRDLQGDPKESSILSQRTFDPNNPSDDLLGGNPNIPGRQFKMGKNTIVTTQLDNNGHTKEVHVYDKLTGEEFGVTYPNGVPTITSMTSNPNQFSQDLGNERSDNAFQFGMGPNGDYFTPATNSGTAQQPVCNTQPNPQVGGLLGSPVSGGTCGGPPPAQCMTQPLTALQQFWATMAGAANQNGDCQFGQVLGAEVTGNGPAIVNPTKFQNAVDAYRLAGLFPVNQLSDPTIPQQQIDLSLDYLKAALGYSN